MDGLSYKSIDIQASLPRTVELAPLAHQQQHKAVNEQAALGQQAMKTTEQDGQRSHKTESATGSTISEREPRERNKRSGNGGKRKGSEQEPEAPAPASVHPYKGKHIDFTL